MSICKGPQNDFCQNLLSLSCDSKIKADYYAFCDQHDVWLATKPATTLKRILNDQDSDHPYLYWGCTTTYVDEKFRKISIFPFFLFLKNSTMPYSIVLPVEMLWFIVENKRVARINRSG